MNDLEQENPPTPNPANKTMVCPKGTIIKSLY